MVILDNLTVISIGKSILLGFFQALGGITFEITKAEYFDKKSYYTSWIDFEKALVKQILYILTKMLEFVLRWD